MQSRRYRCRSGSAGQNLGLFNLPPCPPDFSFRSAGLRVASLDRAAKFYVDVLGFHALATASGNLALAPAADRSALLHLRAVPAAGPASETAPGLFHLALLVPTPADLARVLLRLAEAKYPIQGLSDHGVSAAIYLADPDGNGLEIYADRPRDAWPQRHGELVMFTRPLDVPELLAAAPDSRPAGLPPATTLGHVHLRVADLAVAEKFATTELGLSVTTRAYPGAIFLAADGYHHHFAANTWHVGQPLAPGEIRAGLDSFHVAVPGLVARKTVRGPADISFELIPA